ncbi:hypothetical protein L7F22_050575 [Adiantum nelumboides]|nr:hypothetical protein [Adiantum nelumboides]
MVMKNFIDQEVLSEHETCAVKAAFHGPEYQDCTLMCLPQSMHKVQTQQALLKLFDLIGFGDFFRQKPCQVDALRVHQLITTLQEDGTCKMTNKEDQKVELHLSLEIITRALLLKEGNFMISAMKLSTEERSVAFKADNINDCTYSSLKSQVIRTVLQIHQQYFHFYKPQKYTRPDIHTAYVLTKVQQHGQMMLGDWGNRLLKDLKKAVASKSYQNLHYIGNGTVLTRIAYEALGMRDKLQPMPSDAELFKKISERRQSTRDTRAEKTTSTTATTQVLDVDTEEEQEEEVQPAPRRTRKQTEAVSEEPSTTIRIEEVDVPSKATKGVPMKTKRREEQPIVEEEFLRAKSIIDSIRGRKRRRIDDEQNFEAYAGLHKLHHQGRTMAATQMEPRTKQKRDRPAVIQEEPQEAERSEESLLDIPMDDLDAVTTDYLNLDQHFAFEIIQDVPSQHTGKPRVIRVRQAQLQEQEAEHEASPQAAETQPITEEPTTGHEAVPAEEVTPKQQENPQEPTITTPPSSPLIVEMPGPVEPIEEETRHSEEEEFIRLERLKISKEDKGKKKIDAMPMLTDIEPRHTQETLSVSPQITNLQVILQAGPPPTDTDEDTWFKTTAAGLLHMAGRHTAVKQRMEGLERITKELQRQAELEKIKAMEQENQMKEL